MPDQPPVVIFCLALTATCSYVSAAKQEFVVVENDRPPYYFGKSTGQQLPGFAMNEDIRAALDLGVSTFLKKPYSLEELARTLRRTLDE